VDKIESVDDATLVFFGLMVLPFLGVVMVMRVELSRLVMVALAVWILSNGGDNLFDISHRRGSHTDRGDLSIAV